VSGVQLAAVAVVPITRSLQLAHQSVVVAVAAVVDLLRAT
jgi:hypothetical protein